MDITLADRVKELPPYLFAEIDRLKNEVKARGVDIIDLGVGDPDLPTPDYIVEAIQKQAGNPENHRYPSYEGMLKFRKAAANFMQRRFGVKLNPENEIISLIGSKEGIAHIPLAFINPGDVVLVPDPGYPVYQPATLFAGGEPYFMPLLAGNDFLPDLDSIPADIVSRARMMFINYPNNPTAATATLDFFARVAKFAEANGIIVCHDLAYSEMAFDGYKPPSFLEAEGAGAVGIEFHSLSKTFNMTGWRIGWAAGNAKVVAGLGKIKTNIDSGVFQAVQYAAMEALSVNNSWRSKNLEILAGRRDLMVAGLKEAGFEVKSPCATFYLWVEVPAGLDSKSFASRLLTESGVVVTPGVGFGKSGEGYFRIALTLDEERLSEAVERIRQLGIVSP
jgi:LL-diaminopimelate aminotransferase